MNVTGNFRALVVNNTDPERRARIQVQVPQLMGQAVSGWALPIPADAIVPPRVGSQVLVTFEGGDLSQPLYFATGVGSGGGGGGGGSATTHYQGTEPTGLGEENHGEMWVNSDDLSIWIWNWSGDSGTWIRVAGTAIDIDAALLAALENGLLSEMRQQVDNMIETFYGPAEPVEPDEGDLWLDTTDPTNTILKRYNGAGWVIFENPRIQQAYQIAGTAAATADGKVRTFAQDTEPEDMAPEDVGDLWIDTNDGNKLYRWDGVEWVPLRDASIQDALDRANESIKDSQIEYAVSGSDTVPPDPETGGWSTDTPVHTPGTYVWMRTRLTKGDDSFKYSSPVLVTGNDGATGRSIDHVDVEFYLSSSITELLGGDWFTDAPVWVEGTYLWTRTRVVYTDGGEDVSDAAMISGIDGIDGMDGRGITSVVEQYYLSTSSTQLSGGSWEDTPPEWVEGMYFWTRSVITYTSGSPHTTDPMMVSGSQGQPGISITAVVPHFYRQPKDDPAPDKPTVKNPSGWTTTEPTWVEDTALYRAERVDYSTGDFAWTDVSPVSAWNAASSALSAAAEAKAVADQAAADLIALSGRTGRLIRSDTEPTATLDKDPNNLWLNTSTGQLHEYDPLTGWELITDERLTDAIEAADQAANHAAAAAQSAADAVSLAEAAEQAATAASGHASTAQAAALQSASDAAAAEAASTSALASASAAQTAANTAAQDAADAALAAVGPALDDIESLAGSKADVLIQPTAPAADMRKATTLWIDTTDGNNTPKRWSATPSPGAWIEITDKAAKDAAQAAVDAQEDADQALQEASDLRTRADALEASALAATDSFNQIDGRISTLDGKVTVAYSNPTTADALGKPEGAIWEVHSGGTALRRFILTAGSGGALSWVQARIGQDFIGVNAIGRAQIIDAAVGTAQIGDAAITNAKIGKLAVDTAQIKDLAVTNAKIDSLAVGKLEADTARMNQAAVDQIIGDAGHFGLLTAERLVVASESNLVRNGLGEFGIHRGFLDDSSVTFETTDAPEGVTGYISRTGAIMRQGQSDNEAFAVEGGEEFLVELWLRADKPNSRIYVEVRNQTGAHGATHYPMAGYPSAVNMANGGRYIASDWVVPTTWTKYTSRMVADEGATTLRVGGVYFNHSNGTELGAQQDIAIRIRRRTGEVLIENGAITADKIAANSIGANKLLVGTSPNLIIDPYFGDATLRANRLSRSGTSFGQITFTSNALDAPGAQTGLRVGPGNTSTLALSLGASPGSGPGLVEDDLIELTPGQTYLLEVYVYSGNTTTNQFRWTVRGMRADGTTYYNSITNWTTTDVTSRWYTAEWTCPSTIHRVTFELQANTGVLGWMRFSMPSVRAMTTGVLIENGAITADKIAANSISAEKLLIAPGNIFPDPYFRDSASWTTARTSVGPNPALPGANALKITGTPAGTATGVYYISSNSRSIQIEAGAKYRITFAYSITGDESKIWRVPFYIRGDKQSDNSTSTNQVAVSTPGTSGRAEGVITIPADWHGAATVGFHLYASEDTDGAAVEIADVNLTRMVSSVLIEDGAITAPKLDTGAIRVGHFAEETNKIISDEITSATEELGSSLSSEFTETIDSLPFSDYTPVETFNTRTGDIDTAISTVEQAAAADLSAARTELDDKIETINTTLAENKLYIDINPTDGIRLGHVDNNLNVQITNDRLSFLEGNTEVAYISNQKLYITTAEVTDQLIITRPGLDSSFYFDPRDNGNLSFRFRNN